MNKKILLTFNLMFLLATNNAYTGQGTNEQKIQHQVNMTLEWAQSKTAEELNRIKDTSKLLNPQSNDTEITIEAKKRAKAILFPEHSEEKSLELTKEEKIQQGWPVDMFVPRNIISEKLKKDLQEEVNKQVSHKVDMILEWTQSQSKGELLSKINTVQFLNPKNDDDTIENRAKKIAKQKVLEILKKNQSSEKPLSSQMSLQKSYWQAYAPQFIQDVTRYTSEKASQAYKAIRDYIAIMRNQK